MVQHPLELALAPLANVLLLADDSKSMDWEIVYTEPNVLGQTPDNSLVHIDDYYYGYLYNFGNYPGHPIYLANDNDDRDGHVVPTYEYIVNNYSPLVGAPNYHQKYAELLQLWKMRSHTYNLIYYDPSKTYTPWEGYSEYPATAAPINPTNPTGVTVDLITLKEHTAPRLQFAIPENRAVLARDNAGDRAVNAEPMRIAIYYTLENGVVTLNEISDPNSAEAQNFSNWFTYYRRRLFTAQKALAEVVQDVSGINYGYSTINGSNQVIVGSNTNAAVIAQIFATDADGKTPLRSALYKAGRYFQCAGDALMSGCPIPAEGSGGECQQNFTILMTDGFWDTGTNEPFYDSSASGSVQAFKSINHDANTSSAFDGGPFADSGTQTLADIAMYFYKTDLAPGISNEVPALDVDQTRMAPSKTNHWSSATHMHQHMKTYTVGFGVVASVAQFPQVTDTGVWPAI